MKPGTFEAREENFAGRAGRGMPPPRLPRFAPRDGIFSANKLNTVRLKKNFLGPVFSFCLSSCFSSLVPSGAALADGQKSGVRAQKTERQTERLVVHAKALPAPGAGAYYAAKDVDLGPLGVKKILDTPFSVSEVRRDVLLNQQVRNINDAAKFMPSVQMEQRGDPNVSRPQSRGFESDVINNSRIDGLNVLTTTPYAAEQFDHLTVLNGLSGALFGPQNPGGMFNYVLKRPTETPMARLDVGVDSNGAPVESLDVSGRYKGVGARLNLLNQTGESYVSGSHVRRNMVSGDFDFHLGERTTLYVDGSQYSSAWRGLPGQFTYSAGIKLPSAPDLGQRGYGQKQGGYNTSTDTGLARLEHAFNDDWKVRLGGLYQNAGRDVFTVNNTLTNNRGAYVQTIKAPTTAKTFEAWSNFGYLNGKAQTWAITHALTLGTTGYSLGNYNPLSGEEFSLGTAKIGDPRVVNGPQPHSHGTYKSANTRIQTLMAGDTLAIGRQISVMGMLSWSWLKTKNWSNTGVSNPHNNYASNGVFAPTVTATYKPVSNASFYFNWGKSIQPGLLSPTNKYNQGGVQPPLRSEQYEVGAKWQPWEGLELSADGFRMSRPYAFTDPTTHVFGENGLQRNYGVEFMASGHLTQDLAVMGGVTWLDAQVGKTARAATSHKEVVGVPPVMANILLDYTLPLRKTLFKGTALTANVHYTGKRAADVTNKTFAAAYVTLDLGLRYATRVYGQSLAFRFGVNNVTNARYWASVFPNSINGAEGNDTAMAGLPRTYQFTMTLAL